MVENEPWDKNSDSQGTLELKLAKRPDWQNPYNIFVTERGKKVI